MSYIERSLAANEVVQYRARFHWFYHAIAWGALIAGGLAAVLAFGADTGFLPLVLVLIGIGVWLAILVPIWTTEIGVTSQRIIYKRGLIQRDTNELQVRSIEEVRFVQDFWGRIFNYGKLEIHGTGDDAIFLPAVADPLALRSALQGSIGNAQGDARPANGTPQNPPQPDLRANSA